MEEAVSISQQLADAARAYKVPLVLAALGILFVLVGVGSLLREPKSAVEFVASEATDSADAAESVVDVAGAVDTPGVYRVSRDARVGDIVERAGGFADSADSAWIARNLNLAAQVSDGAKIYIPAVGEADVPDAGVVSGVSNQSAKININTASKSQLEDLPGIGPVTAGKIIDNRPYTTVDELLSKKAVNRGQFEKIIESVTVF